MLLYIVIVGLLGLVYSFFLSRTIFKKKIENKKANEISSIIHKGALTFLNSEYKIMAVFAIVIVLIMSFLLEDGVLLSISFIAGGVFSEIAGRLGMYIATKSNVRVSEACSKGIKPGLKIAFSAGAVMGISVVALGILGVSVFYYFFNNPVLIFGFAFGACYIAFFSRVGGGIYTKAADVGADLVGKVEKGIPEDDPRNPAVIADNVGDNVGDVAGMSADLFDSYVQSIIAAMVIGVISFKSENYVLLPLVLSSIGLVSCVIGAFFVKVGKGNNLQNALNKGIIVSSVLTIIGSYLAIGLTIKSIGIFYSFLSGLISGLVIGFCSEYYTSTKYKPTKEISEASKTGAGTNVIEGIAVGMQSTLIPVLAVAVTIMSAFLFAGGTENFTQGLYGVAISSVGMLSILAIILASDTYGPVADNAAGIAEMANLGDKTRKNAEMLDEVGNTTAAIGKGFAIGSAALTSIVLYVTFAEIIGMKSINLINPKVLIGLFIGGVIPFVFAAFLMRSVGKAAIRIVNEVRRQFKEIKGLMEGKAKPDYEKCIDISTKSALKEMIIPGIIAVIAPIVVGISLGPEALGGMLAGKTIVGFLLAFYMANAGGSWDNAKKYIEKGNFGGKGSDAHKAAVVGDTVGDPMKDTAGPSLNILVKLMGIVAIIFLPFFV